MEKGIPHNNLIDKIGESQGLINVTLLFQPWTAEEQIRLEELLLKYPPEKSDSDRFRKIARELGKIFFVLFLYLPTAEQ